MSPFANRGNLPTSCVGTDCLRGCVREACPRPGVCCEPELRWPLEITTNRLDFSSVIHYKCDDRQGKWYWVTYLLQIGEELGVIY